MASTPMHPGELVDRVRLLQPQAGQGALGGPLSGWQDGPEVWARVRERMGLEGVSTLGGVEVQRTLTRRITVRLRYRAGVRATWAVRLHDGRVVQLIGEPMPVTEPGHLRPMWLDLECQEAT